MYYILYVIPYLQIVLLDARRNIKSHILPEISRKV